jgi:hypothetical protein
MARWKAWPVTAGIALVAGMLVGSLSSVSTASPRGGLGTRQAGGPHLSGVTRLEAMGAGRGSLPGSPSATCSTPGAGNYLADCNTTGRPVNETSIAWNGVSFVAGANDYNSWNGNADLGFYTSTDGKTWTDNGPLDLFPHGSNTAAGDPGLAFDGTGVVYYSGIYFDYFDCTVGGVQLARQDPSDGSWSYYQISPNSNDRFQDKPAVLQDASHGHVFVGWTEYHGSFCIGFNDVFPLRIAMFDSGPDSTPPIKVLSVPGSTYSAGVALASDTEGGFWVTWEEFPSPTSLVGSIKLNHWRPGRGWDMATKTISPPGFTDLPSPLPGFAFRVNSFPMITFALAQPRVVWNSYDTGVGRTYRWQAGRLRIESNSGGDQFFASIGVNSGGKNVISWSQTDQSNLSFDQYLSNNRVLSKVSTASSFPNNDTFFGGTFIGDYNATVVAALTPHPIWTDVRGPTYAQNAMVYSP